MYVTFSQFHMVLPLPLSSTLIFIWTSAALVCGSGVWKCLLHIYTLLGESDSLLLWRWNLLPVNDTTQSGSECGRCRPSRSGSHCQERRWDENVAIRAKVRKAGEEANFFVFFCFFPPKPYDRHQCYEKRSNTQFQRFSKHCTQQVFSVKKKKKKHTSRFSFWLFEGLNYTYHTDKPVVEPGDQRLKSNAFLFCFGHPYKRNEKPQLHRSLGDVQTEKHTHTPFLSLPSTPHHDCPRFSVLGRQALLVSVCRIQRVTRRGEGRCVSQSERA